MVSGVTMAVSRQLQLDQTQLNVLWYYKEILLLQCRVKVDWGALIEGPFPIGYVNGHLLCLGAGL